MKLLEMSEIQEMQRRCKNAFQQWNSERVVPYRTSADEIRAAFLAGASAGAYHVIKMQEEEEAAKAKLKAPMKTSVKQRLT